MKPFAVLYTDPVRVPLAGFCPVNAGEDAGLGMANFNPPDARLVRQAC